ncbi:unnamed protein product [Clonostachys byssicola]|uniref:Heterokaryon incompatibility domain-containing protein n=1 Tax=Clonostachys byssicola TaxID=160290 RepID=A0A9N9UIN4_9HYPO|nr:unnamed protein product [Clonostachys byssicola]
MRSKAGKHDTRTAQARGPSPAAPLLQRNRRALYNALDPRKGLIRLVRIGRRENHPESAFFSLEEHPIDKAPEYMAISYMWGPNTEGGDIELDGHAVHVRQNLYNLIHNVLTRRVTGRKETESPRGLPHDVHHFWVDTLCINQNDLGERSHQVQMMGHIYRSARSVFVWLGPGDDDSDYVFDTHERVRNPKFKQDYEHERFAKALLALFRREYWYRAWIRQEILNAQMDDVTINCGDRSLKLGLLADLCSDGSWGAELNRALGASPVADLVHRDGWAENLDRLLQLYGEGRCSDIRDRVYSLLSLASDQEVVSEVLRVDYTQPTSFLFWQLICYFTKLYDWAGAIAAARGMKQILEVDDQITRSIRNWTKIQKCIGTVPCIDWIREFLSLAREARRIQARKGVGPQGGQPKTPGSGVEDEEYFTLSSMTYEKMVSESKLKDPAWSNWKQHERKRNFQQPSSPPIPNITALNSRAQDITQLQPVIHNTSPAWLRLIRKKLTKNDWFDSLDWFNFTLEAIDLASRDFIERSARWKKLLEWLESIINTLRLRIEQMRKN